MNKIIIFNKMFVKLLSVFLFIALLALIFKNYQVSSKNVIVLTKEGFSPAGIKVKKGTTVKFVSKIGKDFWPASDLHPSHLIYSEFDPKRALKDNEIWEFKFDRVGTIRYHDHINPIYRGTIIVLDENTPTFSGNFSHDYSFSECKSISGIDEKRGCYSNILEDIILQKGPDIAFDFVKRLRDEDPGFAAECHTIVHSLGEISYWKYAKDKKLPKTGKISYCGFGYIHGFMQELGHHSRTFVDDVESICNHFSQKLNYEDYERTVNPADQCYHGVGHGLAYFYVPDYYYDLTEAIGKAARDCEQLTSNETSRSNCKYGIFGGIASMYVGSHGLTLSIDKDNPFKVCEAQDNSLKDACFDSMVPTLGVLWNQDLRRLSQAFSTIDEAYMKQSFYNFGDISSRWFSMGDIKPSDVILNCRYLNSVARGSCFNGFAEGIIRNGYPLSAPTDALSFCESPVLNNIERKSCISGFISEMKLVYPDKIEDILAKMGESDRTTLCESQDLGEYCN